MPPSNAKVNVDINANGANLRRELNSLYGDINKLGGGFTQSFGGAIPIVSALTGAVTGAGLAIFGIAKHAADVGSVLKDFQDKTNLSAESISTLKFAAEQSGVAFDTLSAPIGKFSKLLGEADRGNDKARKTLSDLGIDGKRAFNDIDYAVSAALDGLQKFPEGPQRADAAIRLFGKGGANLTGILQALDKDGFQATIKRAKELGIVLTQEDINAADRFGDTLGLLATQAEAAGSHFSTGFMDVITSGMDDVSHSLATNKDDVREWGKATGEVLVGIKSYWEDAKKALDDYIVQAGLIGPGGMLLKNNTGMSVGETLLSTTPIGMGILKARRRGEQNSYSSAQPDDYAAMQSGQLPYGKTATKGGYDEQSEEEKRAAEKRAQARKKAFQDEMAAQDQRTRLLLEREHDEFQDLSDHWEEDFLAGEITKERYREIATNNAKAYAQKAQKILDDQVARDRKGKTGTALDVVNLNYQKGSASISQTKERELADVEKNIAGIQKKADDDQKQEAEQHNREMGDLAHAQADTRLEILQTQLELGLVKEKEFARQYGQIQLDILEGDRARATDETEIAIIDEKIAQQKQRNARSVFKILKDETKEVEEQAAAYRHLADAAEEAFYTKIRETRDQANERRRAKRQKTVGSGDEISALGQLREHFVDSGNTAAIAGIDAMATAFDGLGQALGSVVSAWVLYGEAGASVQQVTAQILAGIAQQATVKAVFELAEGFAALALSFFGIPNAGPSASAHFTAAAIYGGIAGIAAVAGRGVAGDSMKKGGGKGGSSYSGGSSAHDDKNTNPYSRQSSTIYDSGKRPDGVLANAIDRFIKKVDALPAKHVFMTGMKANPGAVGNQVAKDIGSNAGIGRNIGSKMGLR